MSSPALSKKRRIAASLIHTVKNDYDEEMPAVARAAGLIAKARNILVIAGAGVSTSCGIPENGLYALLSSLDDEIKVSPAAVDLVPSAPDEAAIAGKVKRRRSGRIAATGSSGIDTEKVQGYHIVDPQEIMDITVFRTHPEVF
ncbi:hypothetical protein QFC22_004732 [Naganishia vaughanmartiniae]|uniref:Uncharacterized protein n=1 Tax=Naganishia vaughanmartiniae TaxID=1424756 RepID=A0ACC2WZ25_9TREE|nr:hypothetical protein QFC22_004732 [Naganishia vaughanmartiniae]